MQGHVRRGRLLFMSQINRKMGYIKHETDVVYIHPTRVANAHNGN